MSNELRAEILAAQKARSDFLKWKLIAVGALGSVGFGLGGNTEEFNYVLCLIPFICIYVDALCYHLNLRVAVIGTFLRNDLSDQDLMYRYENFCAQVRNVFTIENWVLNIATLFVSTGIIVVGFLATDTLKITLIASGLCGIALSILINFLTKQKLKLIKNASTSETS